MSARRLKVRHETVYTYAFPVAYSEHVAHLAPRPTPRQTALSHLLSVSPRALRRADREDYFGNPVTLLALEDEHDTVRIIADSTVEIARLTPPDPAASPPWETLAGQLARPDSEARIAASQFVFDSPMTGFTADLPAYALESFTPGRPVLDGAIALMARLHADIAYQPGVTDVSTPVDRVFELRAGVCQDLAHLMIACLRAIGLSARYVSGYLLTRPPPGQAKLQGADESHAWVSVFTGAGGPGDGWVDLDPTNNLLPDQDHVTTAWGRDYADVSPLTGVVIGGGEHTITVRVDVTPEG